jgi:hypothetical protein
MSASHNSLGRDTPGDDGAFAVRLFEGAPGAKAETIRLPRPQRTVVILKAATTYFAKEAHGTH